MKNFSSVLSTISASDDKTNNMYSLEPQDIPKRNITPSLYPDPVPWTWYTVSHEHVYHGEIQQTTNAIYADIRTNPAQKLQVKEPVL